MVKCCILTLHVIQQDCRTSMQSCFSFRPGNLKRGMTSLVDESTMKRSRASSISSVSGIHALKGTPGNTRNPIHSSYSSTGGISQVKLRVVKLCSAALAETRKPKNFIPVFPITVKETHCTQPKPVQSWVASLTDSGGSLKKIQVNKLFSWQ